MNNHHDPQKSENGQILSSLAHLADIFCKAQDFSFIEEFKGKSISDNKGWKIIRENSLKKNLRFDIERFTFGLNEEISKA